LGVATRLSLQLLLLRWLREEAIKLGLAHVEVPGNGTPRNLICRPHASTTGPSVVGHFDVFFLYVSFRISFAAPSLASRVLLSFQGGHSPRRCGGPPEKCHCPASFPISVIRTVVLPTRSTPPAGTTPGNFSLADRTSVERSFSTGRLSLGWDRTTHVSPCELSLDRRVHSRRASGPHFCEPQQHPNNRDHSCPRRRRSLRRNIWQTFLKR